MRPASLSQFPAVMLFAATAHAADLTPAEARAIAKDAYVYGFPLVDNYRVQHSYCVDSQNPEYKAPFNQISNTARVFTPDDKTIQTPNSDTPYSMIGLDLRAEPIVLTVPAIEGKRYFSVQLVDAYTHNFDYIGTRATGNGGGSFLIAGPGWKGEKPAGIAKVISCETEFAFVIYRTQLYDAADLENVKKIQAGYHAHNLSAFLRRPPPPDAPALAFPKPITRDAQRTELGFFEQLDFVLDHCPTHPSEKDVRARFQEIGLGEGRDFDASKLSPEIAQAMKDGMADAWKEFAVGHARVDAGELTASDFFGSRESLKNNYLYRMLGAVLGIYGNTKQEAMYPSYTVDSDGAKLDGAKSAYTVRFEPNGLPPVDAFWSLTMYEMPASLLSANALNRYLINSPMLPSLKRDADGGITLYVSHDSPGKERESNWLPAPKGPFAMAMRLYLPQKAALDGTWKAPKMHVAK